MGVIERLFKCHGCYEAYFHGTGKEKHSCNWVSKDDWNRRIDEKIFAKVMTEGKGKSYGISEEGDITVEDV